MKPYTTAEFASLLNVSRATVARWARQGRIQAVRIGGDYRIPAGQVPELLRPQPVPVETARERKARARAAVAAI